MTNDDSELLRRYAEGRSEQAFAELVQRHLDLVHSTAVRMLAGDAHAAADVAQQVFANLAQHAGSLHSSVILPAWLYSVTRNTAVDFIRKESRRRKRELEAQTMQTAAESSSGLIDWDRVRPVLDQALGALGQTDREAVVLRFLARRSFSEIGAALRLSEDAARMRVERAVGKLHALLTKRGITSTAGALATVLAENGVAAAPAGLAVTISHAVAANAATASVATTGITLLMKPKIIALSGLALLGMGVATYEFFQVRDLRAATAMATAERDLARADLQRIKHGTLTAQARARTAGAASPTSAARISAMARPTFGSAIDASASSRPNEVQIISGWSAQPSPSDPVEARKRLRERNGSVVDAAYGALYRQLGWTAEQREKFKELKLDVDEQTSKLFKAATEAEKARNPGADRAALQDVADATFAQARADLTQAVRNSFGDDAAQAMEHFQATQPVRSMVTQLADALFYSADPLSPTQAEQLVDLLATHARDARGQVTLSALNGDAALAQASTTLSATQLAALRGIVASRQVTSTFVTARGSVGH